MSVFTLLTAGLACLAPFVGAYTTPVGDQPVGNPIALPGSTSTVPVGKDFTVQWTPTTDGTVTLVLLKGPANNLAVVGPIAEHIANSGKFVWKPSTDLTPGPSETTGYGIQLIVDATGQYQYTTQFGISNSGASGYGSAVQSWSSAAATSSWVSTQSLVAYPSSTWTSSADSTTTSCSTSSTDAVVASSTGVVVVTTSWANTTTAAPVTSVPVTLATSAVSVKLSTASRTPSSTASATLATSTGAASNLKSSAMGLFGVAAVALFAL